MNGGNGRPVDTIMCGPTIYGLCVFYCTLYSVLLATVLYCTSTVREVTLRVCCTVLYEYSRRSYAARVHGRHKSGSQRCTVILNVFCSKSITMISRSIHPQMITIIRSIFGGVLFIVVTETHHDESPLCYWLYSIGVLDHLSTLKRSRIELGFCNRLRSFFLF